MAFREEEQEPDNSEYYTLLNLDRNATSEEVRSAYRRLCRIYHPDRYQDPQKQENASAFFWRIQEAYKVLNDPRTRVIYDRSGKKGLVNDMAVIERTTLPSELLEEYEKLKSLWEERTYIQDVNPHGSFRMDMDVSPLVDGVSYEGQPLMTVNKIAVKNSVDAQLTQSAHSHIMGMVMTSRRSFLGGIQFSLCHLLSKQNWVKISTLVGNRPAIGLESYHTLSDRMYMTSHNVCSLSPRGLMLSVSGGLTRRLTDTTSGTLSIRNTGFAVTSQVIHQLSSNTDVVGDVYVGFDNSFVKGTVRYHPDPKYAVKAGLKFGTKGVSAFYGGEQEVATLTRLMGTVLFGMEDGVVLKLRLIRASMSFQIRFQVSQVLSIPAIFYATAVPLALYGLIKMFAVVPLLQRERKRRLEDQRTQKTKEVLEKKKEAEAAIELMQETVERVISVEQSKQGLIIVEAWYGRLLDTETEDGLTESKVIDVRIPLQCLVADSKLIVHENTKANIPGFYDPCLDENKHLRVRYEFRGNLHEVTIEDSEPLLIPRRSHRI